MTAILDPLVLHPGGMLTVDNVLMGTHEEIPTYTCSHCNRMVLMRRDRTRPRATCRRCMQSVCDYCTRECNPFEREVERGQLNLRWQPWNLRWWGEPIDRIWAADGASFLVLRKDNGNTDRAIEKTMRPARAPSRLLEGDRDA